jgi:hypothetical protein
MLTQNGFESVFKTTATFGLLDEDEFSAFEEVPPVELDELSVDDGLLPQPVNTVATRAMRQNQSENLFMIIFPPV